MEMDLRPGQSAFLELNSADAFRGSRELRVPFRATGLFSHEPPPDDGAPEPCGAVLPSLEIYDSLTGRTQVVVDPLEIFGFESATRAARGAELLGEVKYAGTKDGNRTLEIGHRELFRTAISDFRFPITTRSPGRLRREWRPTPSSELRIVPTHPGQLSDPRAPSSLRDR